MISNTSLQFFKFQLSEKKIILRNYNKLSSHSLHYKLLNLRSLPINVEKIRTSMRLFKLFKLNKKNLSRSYRNKNGEIHEREEDRGS